MSFEITGMDEMMAKLTKMGKNIEAVTEKALMAGAEILKAEIEVKAPKDTLNLEKHIVISKVYKKADGEAFVEVGPSLGKGFYGPMNEWGTSKMRGTPFVEPAFLAKKDEVLAAIADEVRKVINNV